MAETTGSASPNPRAQSRREAAIAVAGAALGAIILLGSWLIYPTLTLVSISSPVCKPVAGPATPFYSRGGATLYVTADDILWPDKFEPSDNPIRAVVLGYEINPTATGMPTWNLQVLHALRLEDPYGKRIEAAATLNDVDIALRDQWGSLFPLVPGLPSAKTLNVGDSYVFALSDGSSYAQRSGLKAIMPVGIGSATDPLGAALAAILSTLNVLPDGTPTGGFAISYAHLASTQNSDSGILRNFSALLAAVDQTLKLGLFRTAVIGSWAKTPQQAENLTRGFCLAWSQFKAGLSQDAGTLAHGPLRLPAVGVVAAFLGVLWRRDPMTVRIAVAYYLVIGTVLAVFFGAVALLTPVIASLAPPGALFGLQFAIAALCGWHLRRLARYDPKQLVAGGTSK